MSKRNSNKLWLMGVTSLSCLSAGLGALALRYSFDYTVGQFESRAPLWILTQVFGLIALLVAGLYPILALKKENYSPDYKISPFIDFASLFAASMLILDAVSTFLRNREPVQNILTAKAVLAAAAALFFIALFTKRSLGTPVMTVLAGLTTLWAVFEAFYSFLNPIFSMTSPFRTYPQLPCLALALLMLMETKTSDRKAKESGNAEGNQKKPLTVRFLIAAASVSCALCILIGGAIVIAYVLNWNRDAFPATDGLWMLALGIYAFARTRQILFSK